MLCPIIRNYVNLPTLTEQVLGIEVLERDLSDEEGVTLWLTIRLHATNCDRNPGTVVFQEGGTGAQVTACGLSQARAISPRNIAKKPSQNGTFSQECLSNSGRQAHRSRLRSGGRCGTVFCRYI